MTIGPLARIFLMACAVGMGALAAAPFAPLAAQSQKQAPSQTPTPRQKPAAAKPPASQTQNQAPAPAPPSTPSPGQGLGLTDSNDKRPLDVEADQGIEWQQDNQVYIARGNARATRGNATLYGDTLIAHYRPLPPDRAKPPDPNSLTGSTEIYRIEADGNVRLKTETQTVFGDHGVYDLDSATAIVTGKHLRLITPRDVVTARDSLEWYDNKQIAVARGDALSVRDDAKRLAGDVLTAQVVKPPDGPSRISRIDAQGHVVVTTINEIARGATGVYNVDTGIATLAGGVTITRGDNEMRGQYGVVDLNKNVSRLLSSPPGDPTRRTPVQGLVIPRGSSKPPPPSSPPARSQ